MQALSAAVESTDQAKAEAQSRAELARVESEAAVQQAQLKAEAASIEAGRDHLNVAFSFLLPIILKIPNNIRTFAQTFEEYTKASTTMHRNCICKKRNFKI